MVKLSAVQKSAKEFSHGLDFKPYFVTFYTESVASLICTLESDLKGTL
jgi:hypothetical protein